MKSQNNQASTPYKKAYRSFKRKPEGKKPEAMVEIQKFPDYEPTNIGLTFDAEYHAQKKVKSYWKQYYGEEEDLALSDVLKDL